LNRSECFLGGLGQAMGNIQLGFSIDD
jgi:hypothetical protein